MHSGDPANVGLHVVINLREIVVVHFHEGSHGESAVSGPVIVVRSSLVNIGIRGSENSSLATNIDVIDEIFVHSLVIGLLERVRASFETDVFAGVFR